MKKPSSYCQFATQVHLDQCEGLASSSDVFHRFHCDLAKNVLQKQVAKYIRFLRFYIANTLENKFALFELVSKSQDLIVLQVKNPSIPSWPSAEAARAEQTPAV